MHQRKDGYMKTVIHDLDQNFDESLKGTSIQVIWADGKYAPCQGCFHCWTKNPATCDLKDSLEQICRVIGQADELVIITENYYGGYSPAVKNILDRSIGTSTPMSTYRGKQMHHTLRYGKHNRLKVVVYGDIASSEMKTWELMVERNALNEGYAFFEVSFLTDLKGLEVSAL